MRTFPAMAKVIPMAAARDTEGNPTSSIPGIVRIVEGRRVSGIGGGVFVRENERVYVCVVVCVEAS